MCSIRGCGGVNPHLNLPHKTGDIAVCYHPNPGCVGLFLGKCMTAVT